MNYPSVEKFFDAVQEVIKHKAVEIEGLLVKDKKVAPENAEQYNKDLMTQQNQQDPSGPRYIQKDIWLIVGKHFQADNTERSVEKAADEIISKYGKHPVVNNDNKIPNLNQGNQDVPNQMEDRGSNKMESRIMKFKEFVNENLGK